MSSTAAVQPLDAAHAPEVIRVMADAFHRYPVMRFVLGDTGDYDTRLLRLLELFVMARVHRGEPMFGIRREGALVAAAIVSFPGRTTPAPEFGVLRERVWRDLGADTQARYTAFGDATRPFGPEATHVHLNMIGVVSALRGTGLGRRLIDAVHGLSAGDAESAGVSLTTEDPRNVPLYEHLGYVRTGHARVGPDLETWGFFRPDPG